MKVLQIINNLGSGGAEKLLESLVPLLNARNNVEVDVLLLTDKKNVYENIMRENNVNIYIIPYNNIYDPRNVFAIRKYLIKRKYDIVHSHLFPTQYWVAFASLFLKNKIKFITTEHSTNNRRRTKKYLRILEKLMYSRYNRIISISTTAQNNLLDWIKPKDERLGSYTVIENGINLDRIKEAKPYDKRELINKKDLKENTVFVTMVGRFSQAKNQSTLIKAINKLPDNYHLILLGEGPLIDDNIRLVQNLNVNDRVHFLGFRQDVERIIETSDIIVLSTHWEGLSLASIEALASGKPFIASSVPGVEEVVKNRGLLFEDGNVEKLASLIVKLMNNEELTEKVVKRSLEASKTYDIRNTISQLLDVYNS